MTHFKTFSIQKVYTPRPSFFQEVLTYIRSIHKNIFKVSSYAGLSLQGANVYPKKILNFFFEFLNELGEFFFIFFPILFFAPPP